MEELTTKDYIELIKEWGADRKITTNGLLGSQVLKFVSEYSEYKENIDKSLSIKDDLGDMTVVLVVIAELSNIKTEEVLVPSPSQSMQVGKTESLIGRQLGLLTDGALKGNDLTQAIKVLFIDILEVAKRNRLQIKDCLAVAWDDIKDRKGIMTKTGVFVKSTDVEYERIVAEEA